MLRNLEITKSEYLSILKNRGKYISPSISFDKLLKESKYLKKRHLKHLLSVRGIEIERNVHIQYLRMFTERNKLTLSMSYIDTTINKS